MVKVYGLRIQCGSTNDCAADECCLQNALFFRPSCQKLKQEGDFCVASIVDNAGVYKFLALAKRA